MTKTRNIILLVFTIFCFSLTSSYAQVKGTIEYKLTTNDGFMAGSKVSNYIVYFYGNKSIEVPIPKNTKNSLVADGDNSLIETKIIGNSKPVFIYKNFATKELQLSDYIQRNLYLIKDTLANFKWKVSKEHKKILDYNCTKATTSFRGRTYEAWFTDEIPIANGPWKFCGLPGLIIAVKDLNSIYSYEITGINLKAKFNISSIAVPTLYKKDKIFTHFGFMNAYKKRVATNEALSRVSTQENNGTSTSMTVSLPPKIEKF